MAMAAKMKTLEEQHQVSNAKWSLDAINPSIFITESTPTPDAYLPH